MSIINKYFTFACLVLALLSCSKDPVGSEGVPGEVRYKTVTFETVATKTDLGPEGNVEWEKGDKISVYYLNAEGQPATAVATASSAGARVGFTAQIPETDNPEFYYATYPSGKGTLTVVNNKPSFTINVTGDACDGSFRQANFAAAYTESNLLEFHNAVGIVKVKLPEGGSVSDGDRQYPITGVYLRCKSTSVMLNGKLTFKPTAASDKMFTASTKDDSMGGKANVFLSQLSEDVVKGGYVYLPCTPGVWPDGICLRYYSYAGKIPAVLTKEKEVVVERGHILPIADFSSKIVWDYYVAPDAPVDADGLSETSPMTLESLHKKYISAATTIAGAMRLDGASVNFAEGEYKLASSFAFPVSPSGTEFTLVMNGNGAVLDGNGSQIMKVHPYSHIIMNDFVMQNGYSADGGAGVFVNYSSNSTDSNSSVLFKNCRFLRNVTLAGGGAVMISSSSAGGLVMFDNCYFKENEAQQGAALYAFGGKAAAMFNKCTFFKDKALKNGVEIYMNNASCRLAVNNSTFNAYDAYRIVDGQISRVDYISNGSVVTNKGYSVIANSTIWSDGAPGEWGSVALGLNGNVSGSAIISSVVRNAYAKPAFYLHGKYSQNIVGSIYTGLSAVEGAASNETYFIDNISYDAGIGGAFSNAAHVSGSSYDAYSWEWNTDYPCMSLRQIRTAIAETAEVGPLFLKWLDSIEGSLTTDIAGRPRNENAMCPGSYQQSTTPEGPAEDVLTSALRVMSFNILREDLGGSGHLWTDRKEAVLRMLSTDSPDIIGLQECSWTIREDILKADPRRKAIGKSISGMEEGYTQESSNSIVYRSDLYEVLKSGMFWFSDTPDKCSNAWAASKPRTCTWGRFKIKRTGQEFYHYNVHLHNGSTAAEAESRLKSLRLVLSRIKAENKDGIPVIITGDHNGSESSYTEVYGPSAFVSVRSTAPVSDKGRTFNGWKETGGSVIDHIYVSNQFKANSFNVDRSPYAGVTYVSDHYPVYCDLTLKTTGFAAVTDSFTFDECDIFK